MNKGMRRFALLVSVAGLTLGATAPAFAGPPEPPAEKVKCNSGSGNGAELVGGIDCDPGKGNQPTEHNLGRG